MWCGLKNIHVSFGEREVLSDVSLDVAEGETVAIVGPSGSGKTTLLSVLGMLLEPDEGERWIAGMPMKPGTTPDPGTISWVHQDSNLIGSWSALDNAAIAALGANASVTESFARAEERLGDMGIGALALQPSRLLSGGEQQRLCIARALAARPRLLLLDEPTGQLDADTTRAVLQKLLAVDVQASILVVTHDMAVAEACDRTLMLRQGVLTE